MKNLVRLLLFSTCFCMAGCTQPSNNSTSKPTSNERQMSFLKTYGRTIVNEDGEKVLLKGTNLGGWLHMEGWMDGGGAHNNHYAVLEALRARFTDSEVEDLLEVYQTNYIQESDLEYIASLGLNLVRIPFFWTEIMDFEGNIKDNAFDQLDWAIDVCKKLGLYVLLDLHGAPGGHSNGWLSGGHTDSNELWTNERNQVWAVNIWETLATRYKDEPTVYAYGLLNEPVLPESGAIITIPEMYTKLYKAIRAIDPNHIIVMGAFYNFDYLGSPASNGWENVVYETHHYDNSNYSFGQQNTFVAGQLSYIEEYSKKWNVPVLAGEFNFWSIENAWRTWLYTLSARDVSWCNWTYKNTEQNADKNWGLYHQPTVEYVDFKNDSLEEIAQKWSQFRSENYVRNEFLKSILEDAAKLGWDKINGETIDTKDFKVTTYKTDYGYDVSSLMDGDILSDWMNGEPQHGENQWIEIDAQKEVTINRIDIFCTHVGDYGRKLKVSAFIDGVWVEVGLETGYPGIVNIRFNKVSARYWRIEQVGMTDYWWRINEILVYLENR
ncbi:MAG: cellulase family glycosylhydrolase [Erysipelotrichales bacterium]|nr:cellulase family glycosylhydrolase [Erysipelotrichales bacterium]